MTRKRRLTPSKLIGCCTKSGQIFTPSEGGGVELFKEVEKSLAMIRGVTGEASTAVAVRFSNDGCYHTVFLDIAGIGKHGYRTNFGKALKNAYYGQNAIAVEFESNKPSSLLSPDGGFFNKVSFEKNSFNLKTIDRC